eukprot:CAMPEP_0114503040 /NCGR_PEP_ID=MMETSP0109-20121206/9429_1 /TAXON_ID=29199 /ORGANISM="Chlorarachnion reptans, Strain CCCM449" /LENGTH=533 /DNA_ID=CAMNT_0001681029 /DNA_START=379 /DNA_END=1977 /DNA_ORIENTATION=-
MAPEAWNGMGVAVDCTYLIVPPALAAISVIPSVLENSIARVTALGVRAAVSWFGLQIALPHVLYSRTFGMPGFNREGIIYWTFVAPLSLALIWVGVTNEVDEKFLEPAAFWIPFAVLGIIVSKMIGKPLHGLIPLQLFAFGAVYGPAVIITAAFMVSRNLGPILGSFVRVIVMWILTSIFTLLGQEVMMLSEVYVKGTSIEFLYPLQVTENVAIGAIFAENNVSWVTFSGLLVFISVTEFVIDSGWAAVWRYKLFRRGGNKNTFISEYLSKRYLQMQQKLFAEVFGPPLLFVIVLVEIYLSNSISTQAVLTENAQNSEPRDLIIVFAIYVITEIVTGFAGARIFDERMKVRKDSSFAQAHAGELAMRIQNRRRAQHSPGPNRETDVPTILPMKFLPRNRPADERSSQSMFTPGNTFDRGKVTPAVPAASTAATNNGVQCEVGVDENVGEFSRTADFRMNHKGNLPPAHQEHVKETNQPERSPRSETFDEGKNIRIRILSTSTRESKSYLSHMKASSAVFILGTWIALRPLYAW